MENCEEKENQRKIQKQTDESENKTQSTPNNRKMYHVDVLALLKVLRRQRLLLTVAVVVHVAVERLDGRVDRRTAAATAVGRSVRGVVMPRRASTARCGTRAHVGVEKLKSLFNEQHIGILGA